MQYGILLEEEKKKPVPKAEPWCIVNLTIRKLLANYVMAN